MSRAKDEDIYQFVLAHPAATDRSVERIAMELDLEPQAVRIIAFQSKRLRLRNVLYNWHVVELAEQDAHVATGA